MNRTVVAFSALLLSTLTCTKQECNRECPLTQTAIERAHEQNTQLIECAFVDIHGTQRSVHVPLRHFKSALKDGLSFDGSSIPGMNTIAKSDMLLMLDPATFVVLPGHNGEPNTGRILCDVYLNTQDPYPGDPRGILQKMLNRADALGYEFYVGPELEFFLTKILRRGEIRTCTPDAPVDVTGYFEAPASPFLNAFYTQLDQLLIEQNIDAEKHHHEVAPAQYEFSIKYNHALKIADDIVCAKKSMTTLAHGMDLHTSFMPKPRFGENGSGMHINFSLLDRTSQRNAFHDPTNPHQLSAMGKHFIAGVLNRIKELTVLFNPTINSYKRIVPGYEAPCNVGWGELNRSCVIRLPHNRGVGAATRGELRSPDPACNPYLAFAALLAAGLAGIENKEALPEPIEGNVFQMSDQQLKERTIEWLPANLAQAVDLFENSAFAHEIFGTEFVEKFVALKKKEIQAFQTAVTDWEIKKYF